MRTELATWDAAKEKWEPPTRQGSVRFRPDGQIAEINDGSNSRTTYAYNQAGQILETRSESEDGPFKTIYTYAGSGRLVRTIIIDENGNESGSEVFNYDAGGRKTGIRFHPGSEANWRGLHYSSLAAAPTPQP